MKQFNLSEQGLALIKRFEGCKLTAYQDSVGVWTIGYGHTKTAKQGQTITQAQADQLLAEDVRYFENGLNRFLSDNHILVTQCQFDALVSLTFNIGLANFKRSTLMKLLYTMSQNDQRSIYAVADQFLRWKYAGKKELAGLVKRRNAERLHFLGVS